MHSYRKASYEARWIVGFYFADGERRELKEFTSEEAAAAYASYLNGGNNPHLAPWLTTTEEQP